MSHEPSKVLLAITLLSALVPASRAQMGAVNGRDTVVLGALYQRTAAGTDALARFGVVAGEKGSQATTVNVDSGQAAGLGAYSVQIAGRRKGSGVEVSWTFVPAQGGALANSSGAQQVESGTMGRLNMASGDGAQVYASVEVGHAADFPYDRIARAFGMPGASASSPPQNAAAQAPIAAPSGWTQPAAPSGWLQPAPMAAAAPAAAGDSQRTVLLAMKIEQDGKVVFAPQVRTVSGRDFSVAGGDAVTLGASAGSRPYDGVLVAGKATLSGDSAWLDLSVQSGRALSGAAPGTFIVDRFRQGLQVPLGREVSVTLFDDVAGAGGSLRLLLTATAP